MNISGLIRWEAVFIVHGVDMLSKCSSKEGAQIDLVIDQKNQTVNFCEMKYAQKEFVIDKKYDEVLRSKITAFQEETHTHKSLQLTFVTTYGVKQNAYSGHVQKEVLLEDFNL